MGWCSATIIMDAALDAVTASVAAAWQIASGMEDARTPEYVNALNADPELQKKLDDVIRPHVARLARKLHEEDWDCEQDSRYFDRFPQEMLGLDDTGFAEWQRKQGIQS